MCVARVMVCVVVEARVVDLDWIPFFAGFDTKIVGFRWMMDRGRGGGMGNLGFLLPFMIYQFSYSLRDPPPPALSFAFPLCSYLGRTPLVKLGFYFLFFFFSWLFMLPLLLTTTIIITYFAVRSHSRAPPLPPHRRNVLRVLHQMRSDQTQNHNTKLFLFWHTSDPTLARGTKEGKRCPSSRG